MNKSELGEALTKDYLYEEYFIRKFTDFLKQKINPEMRSIISTILSESKAHSATFQGLMKQLNINKDIKPDSTGWLLGSLAAKKGAAKSANDFLTDALKEEVDLRHIYENQVAGIKDDSVSGPIRKIIEDEKRHEQKIRELLSGL